MCDPNQMDQKFVHLPNHGNPASDLHKLLLIDSRASENDNPSRHVKEVHFRNQVSNNNIQERLNEEFRDREKTFRGLKKDDSPAITRIQLYHNYIRPHMSLDNDTPASRAGIDIKGDNKWKTIIQNASLNRNST